MPLAATQEAVESMVDLAIAEFSPTLDRQSIRRISVGSQERGFTRSQGPVDLLHLSRRDQATRLLSSADLLNEKPLSASQDRFGSIDRWFARLGTAQLNTKLGGAMARMAI